MYGSTYNKFAETLSRPFQFSAQIIYKTFVYSLATETFRLFYFLPCSFVVLSEEEDNSPIRVNPFILWFEGACLLKEGNGPIVIYISICRGFVERLSFPDMCESEIAKQSCVIWKKNDSFIKESYGFVKITLLTHRCCKAPVYVAIIRCKQPCLIEAFYCRFGIMPFNMLPPPSYGYVGCFFFAAGLPNRLLYELFICFKNFRRLGRFSIHRDIINTLRSPRGNN